MVYGLFVGGHEGTSAAETFHPTGEQCCRRPCTRAFSACRARRVSSDSRRCRRCRSRWSTRDPARPAHRPSSMVTGELCRARARTGIAPRALQSNGTRRFTRTRAPVRPSSSFVRRPHTPVDVLVRSSSSSTRSCHTTHHLRLAFFFFLITQLLCHFYPS